MAGADHADFVDYIKRILELVPEIGGGKGKIILRPRDVQDIDEIEEQFTAGTPPIINAWVISKERMTADRVNMPASHERRMHYYVVTGFYGMSDELDTDTTFHEILNNLLDTFITRRNKVVAGEQPFFEDTLEISVRVIDVRVLGAFVCHYAEIALTFSERIQHSPYLS